MKSIQGTTAPLPPEWSAKASDSRGAYGGVAAYEAFKLRSREAQRRVRKRHKVSLVQLVSSMGDDSWWGATVSRSMSVQMYYKVVGMGRYMCLRRIIYSVK